MRNLTLIALASTLLVACCPPKDGERGIAGKPGVSCGPVDTVAGYDIVCTDGSVQHVYDPTNGIDGHDGDKGDKGDAGDKGDKGDKGDTGDTGNTGAPGTPGTIITVVQLCTAPTVYPTTFTEVAFCMGGNLYGVYSENNGFLSLLPVGSYYSNGHNSSCNVTILPNCAVSH